MDVMHFLAEEAAKSVSGITLDCAHWPGYETAYRWMSKHCIGDWQESPEKALESYQKKLDASSDTL